MTYNDKEGTKIAAGGCGRAGNYSEHPVANSRTIRCMLRMELVAAVVSDRYEWPYIIRRQRAGVSFVLGLIIMSASRALDLPGALSGSRARTACMDLCIFYHIGTSELDS